MPNQTIDAVSDHLDQDRSLIDDSSIQTAHDTLTELAAIGIDFSDVAKKLELEGVTKFQEAFTSLLQTLQSQYQG